MFDEHYDWSHQYATHLYGHRQHVMPANEEELRGYDCGVGDAMRHVLFGDKKLLSNQTYTG